MDRNAQINILLWGITIWLCWIWSFWFLLLPVAIHAVNDFVFWKFGKTLFNTDLMVVRAYQVVNDLLSDQTAKGLELGFNFYEGDVTRTRSESQLAKWNFVFKQLNLKAGQKFIDIGCGYGDWLNFVKSQGLDVMGVNISKPQAESARKLFGIEVLNVNWKDILKDPDLQKKLYGKFDAVTFMDTIEHYVPATARNRPEIQEKIYTDMFCLAYNLINPESECGRVFLSCLHQTSKKWTFHQLVGVYLINRTMSGFYPIGDDGLVKHAAKYFTEIDRTDRTEDYRVTGAVERQHFQTKDNFKINLKTIILSMKWVVLDPYFIHRILNILVDGWMVLYGPGANEKEYDATKRSKLSIVRLWMITLQKKKQEGCLNKQF